MHVTNVLPIDIFSVEDISDLVSLCHKLRLTEPQHGHR